VNLWPPATFRSAYLSSILVISLRRPTEHDDEDEDEGRGRFGTGAAAEFSADGVETTGRSALSKEQESLAQG
jgi:hypothetical protein